MSAPFVRVLIADDFKEWRVKVRGLLNTHSTINVVGEAVDGLEAIHQAQALKPDLILLDIGLPHLNGIEVARVMRDSGLATRVLFVSENRHWEIAEEALRTGAWGYVIKAQAASELLPAIEAVLQGKEFVSASLQPYRVDREFDKGEPSIQFAAPLAPRNIPIRHEVAYYPDDEALEQGFARTAEAVLNVQRTVLIIATKAHRSKIYRHLQKSGADLDRLMKAGRYIEIDAEEAISKIMAGNIPDRNRCAKLVDEVIRHAQEGYNEPRRIAICGECAPLLLRDKNVEGTIQLEHLWDEVTRSHFSDTLCGYVESVLPGDQASSTFHRICAEHTAVHGRELGY